MMLPVVVNGAVEKANTLLEVEREKKLQEEKSASQPLSWGSDRLSISAEGRAAAQAATKGQSENSDKKNEQEKEDLSASDEFAAYMKQSRSRTKSASYEDQIKALQNKLKGLQNKLAQVATKNGSEGGGASQVETLNTQINEVTTQISELSSQSAKDKKES